jgi:outer membrane receptor for ferrienterochelin and colicin
LLESLDPGRIERIEVLKGAAAARLFTEEAAGGVIQIFLKAEGGER